MKFAAIGLISVEKTCGKPRCRQEATTTTTRKMKKQTGKSEVAEREGFEPSVLFTYARFPGVCLKPLSHLSTGPEELVPNGNWSQRLSERQISLAKATWSELNDRPRWRRLDSSVGRAED